MAEKMDDTLHCFALLRVRIPTNRWLCNFSDCGLTQTPILSELNKNQIKVAITGFTHLHNSLEKIHDQKSYHSPFDEFRWPEGFKNSEPLVFISKCQQ